MEQKILFLHRIESNLINYIHLDNFYYEYIPATYWEPDDEIIEYNVRVDDDFYEDILQVKVIVDENSEIVEFNYKLNWYYYNCEEFFRGIGWIPFYDGVLENFADNKEQAKDMIDSYVEELVDKKVSDYSEKYGDLV